MALSVMMTSCVGVCFPVVADTSSEGQESEELGLSGENAARLRRENSGMLQLMHTLVTILSVGFSMQVCMCGGSVCVWSVGMWVHPCARC